MNMNMMKLFFFVVILTLGSTMAFPIGGGKGENHFGRVTVDVRDITNDSAVMDWIVPNDGRVIHSYKVTCVEISSTAKEDSVITHSAPKNADHLRIRGLKPESNYSCVLLASHDRSNEEWNRLIQPIEFTTHKTDRARDLDTVESSNSNGGTTLSFTDIYTQNRVYFLLGGLLPVLLIAGCVGGCVIWRKVRAFKKDGEEQNYRTLRNSRFDRHHPDLGRGHGQSPGNTFDYKDAGKMADRIAAKYGLPRRANSPNPSMFTDNMKSPQVQTGLLHSPRGNEKKAMSPNEFNEALMKIGETFRSNNQSFEEQSQASSTIASEVSSSASSDSINLPSLISTSTLSTPGFPLLASGYLHKKYDLPKWSRLSLSGNGLYHLQAPVTLDDILPPIPPPRDDDIIV